MQRPAVADYPAGARLPTRVIDDYELIWMLRGQARLLTDDGELTLHPGLLVLVPPGLRHGFEWDERRPCRHGYLRFDRADAGMALPRSVHSRRMTEHDPLAGLCAHLLWFGRASAPGSARRTLRFLLTLMTSGPLPVDESESAFAGPIRILVTHLRHEWSSLPLRRIGIDELAARAGVSRGHLSRLFQAELGIGIAACLERLRCYRAEILLARTDFPVARLPASADSPIRTTFRTDSPGCMGFRRASTGRRAARRRSTSPPCGGLPASCGSLDLIRGCPRGFAGAGSWVVSPLTVPRGSSPREVAPPRARSARGVAPTYPRPTSAGHPLSLEAPCASP
jgi:AraC family transcriptional regulator